MEKAIPKAEAGINWYYTGKADYSIRLSIGTWSAKSPTGLLAILYR
jgi:hypothetical protein